MAGIQNVEKKKQTHANIQTENKRTN